MRIAILIFAVLLAGETSAQTISGSQGGAVDVSADEIQRMIKVAENNPMRSVDAGKHTVVVMFEIRQPKSASEIGDSDHQIHSELTEVYYIIQGSATLKTGGKLVDPRKLEITGTLPGTNYPRFPSPTFKGKSEGGVSRKVKAGDIVVLPPNTLHGWESVDSPLSYINLRIDPEHKLLAGYTHPALQR